MSTFAYGRAALQALRLLNSPAANQAKARLLRVVPRKPLPFAFPFWLDGSLPQNSAHSLSSLYAVQVDPAVPALIDHPSGYVLTQVSTNGVSLPVTYGMYPAQVSVNPTVLADVGAVYETFFGGGRTFSYAVPYVFNGAPGIFITREYYETPLIPYGDPAPDFPAIIPPVPAKAVARGWMADFIKPFDLRAIVPSAPPAGEFPTRVPLYLAPVFFNQVSERLPWQVQPYHWYTPPETVDIPRPSRIPSLNTFFQAGAPVARLGAEHVLQPPSVGVKERKGKPVNKAAYDLINNVLGNVTESADFINAIYNTLPHGVKPRHKTAGGKITNYRRRFVDTQTKLKVIYANAHRLDLDATFKAVLTMQIQDAMIGKTNQVRQKQLRDMWGEYRRTSSMGDGGGVRATMTARLAHHRLISNIHLRYKAYQEKRTSAQVRSQNRRLERQIAKLDRRFAKTITSEPDTRPGDLQHVQGRRK